MNNLPSSIPRPQNAGHMTRGVFCTLAGGIMWGFSGTCGQYLFTVKQLDPAWLTVTRMLSAGIILLAAGFAGQRKAMSGILKNKRDLLQLIIFAILGLTACQYTYLTAISYSNAGTATVLQYLGPLLIMIVSCAAALRLPTGREASAILLAVFGTFLLATHGNLHSLVIAPQGLFWGLSSAVALMLYTMLPVNIIGRWGSTVVTGYGMLFGGIFLYVVTRHWTSRPALDGEALLAVAAIVLFGTALSFTLYLKGVSEIGSVKASMLACIEPVAAAAFSAVWLGTKFTAMDVLGLAAIVTTVLLLTKREKGKQKTD